ncbi:cytochrome c556 [Constrictibacter sp. MBR-5]|jgi:cytochrome c556|uniref:c-type cytochrome n=1 Tax=Constrictibacter sp. MBR-5 TaxID=3156467 RepID=UPI003398942F
MAGVKGIFAGVAAVALISIGFAASAQDGAQSVKDRQALMKGIAANNKAIAAIVKGEGSETLDDLKRRAGEINAAAAKVPAAFTAGLHVENAPAGVETTALPAIWTERAKFDEASKALEEASAKLAASADMDAAKAGFGAVGKSCGGCHNTFRQKKS